MEGVFLNSLGHTFLNLFLKKKSYFQFNPQECKNSFTHMDIVCVESGRLTEDSLKCCRSSLVDLGLDNLEHS